jgi:hypothetical protein
MATATCQFDAGFEVLFVTVALKFMVWELFDVMVNVAEMVLAVTA